MRPSQIVNRLRRNEDGHTMIAVVGAIALVSLLVGAALAATNGDLRLTKRDLDAKRAYASAQAGLADYAFHLNTDNAYWSKCTTVASPNAVNQQGSTTNRRSVPGDTTAQYAIELIPATGQASCNTADPNTTMLETGTQNTGSFRIRSTGYAGNADQSIVATFKRASLLDFLYFTQLETSDPVTYGSGLLAGASAQCSKYEREGRYSQVIPGSSQFCDRIVFVSGDDINGPLHTNDYLAICGSPTLGRTSADTIEVSAPPQGWQGRCGGDSPNFVGRYVTNAPVLTPPPSNANLATIAGAANTYTGQTTITLSGTNTTITSSAGTVTKAIPASGVIYVKNGTCSTGYSPFGTTYPSTSGCGTAQVSGTYSGQLTIAAENDVLIMGNLTHTGNGLLGLIANNFVRVYHPCTTSNQAGSLTDPTIDAAILAIQHSFIVDNYNCGSPLGNLTVNGAIAQKYRGAVGQNGGGGITHGYIKNYNYDDRLRYQEPPNFLDPVETAWHIQRQTLDFP
jgi:Tfp pilus assembly protein PilX